MEKITLIVPFFSLQKNKKNKKNKTKQKNKKVTVDYIWIFAIAVELSNALAT